MATVTQKVPQLGSELSSSDDNAMIMKQILATHATDSRQVDVKPFLQIIEDIFERADDGIPSIFQVYKPCPLYFYFTWKLVLCIYFTIILKIWFFFFEHLSKLWN